MTDLPYQDRWPREKGRRLTDGFILRNSQGCHTF